MLSIGWPELMIVAAAALIIVGPRDLPMLLKNIGNIVGKVRGMGNDFRRELNKVTALDEIKDIKTSITKPLSDTRAEIEQDFNKITDFGVEPSGAIKPKNPDATDVYDEIKAASSGSSTASAAAKASMAAAVTTATSDTAIAEREKQAQLKKQAIDEQNLVDEDEVAAPAPVKKVKTKPAAKSSKKSKEKSAK